MYHQEYANFNITIRILEQNLLNRNNYDALNRASSVAESLEVLSQANYPVHNNTTTNRDYETMLMAKLEDQFELCYASAPQLEVINIFGLRFVYHNIKVLLKEKTQKSDLSHLLIKIGEYSVDELRKMVNDPEHHILDSRLNHVVKTARAQDSDAGIDIFLDKEYLNHISLLAKEIADPDIQDVVQKIIDRENLMMGIRMKKMNLSHNYIISALSESGEIRSPLLFQAIQSDTTADLVNLLDHYDYDKAIIQEIEESDTIPVFKLGHLLDNQVHELMQSARLMPASPLVVLSYLYYLLNEIANIRLILIGKEINLTSEQFKERMKPIYDN